MTSSTFLPITGVSIVVDDSWRAVPLGSSDGADWADALIAEWCVDGLAAASLHEQLERLRTTLSARLGPEVTALVWVPAPASGYCGAGLVAVNWPVGDSGIRDVGTARELFGAGGFIGEGDTVLEQRLWSGELRAGPFAAVHRVTASPAGEEEAVLETVDFLLFPTGASEFLHLTFTAESISAFDDMPSQTQAIAETVECTVGSAA